MPMTVELGVLIHIIYILLISKIHLRQLSTNLEPMSPTSVS